MQGFAVLHGEECVLGVGHQNHRPSVVAHVGEGEESVVDGSHPEPVVGGGKRGTWMCLFVFIILSWGGVWFTKGV